MESPSPPVGSGLINQLPYEINLAIFKELSDLHSVHALAATAKRFQAVLEQNTVTIWTAVGYNVAHKITENALGQQSLEVATFHLAIWAYMFKKDWKDVAVQLSHLSGKRTFTELDVAVMQQTMPLRLEQYEYLASDRRDGTIHLGVFKLAMLGHFQFLCSSTEYRLANTYTREQLLASIPFRQHMFVFACTVFFTHSLLHESLLRAEIVGGARKRRILKRMVPYELWLQRSRKLLEFASRQLPAKLASTDGEKNILACNHEGYALWSSMLFQSSSGLGHALINNPTKN
ncbi:hypothetical protein F5Y18DRAFT_315651 [Xylariaceae sp. FL1019]|nr:hypothetical protein F5Y18DRAFT_315651 [Xylariaceae sp. FL1019]